MFEVIVITTFISVWTIERIYFYYYTNNKNEAILNLNTGVLSNNNNLNTVNSLNIPLANSENAYYYSSPVYNSPTNNEHNNTHNNTHNNKHDNEHNDKNSNQNNTINI